MFFVDAAHFVIGAFLGFMWCFERVFIKSPSGRKRFNVLDALNAITHEVITVTNETYINAESVCQLLRKFSRSQSFPEPLSAVYLSKRKQFAEIPSKSAFQAVGL